MFSIAMRRLAGSLTHAPQIWQCPIEWSTRLVYCLRHQLRLCRLQYPIPEYCSKALSLCSQAQRVVTHGMKTMSEKEPVKKRVYGSSNCFNMSCSFFLITKGPHVALSVGFPHSEGTNSLTEADLALAANVCCCLPSAQPPTALITTSISFRAVDMVQGMS